MKKGKGIGWLLVALGGLLIVGGVMAATGRATFLSSWIKMGSSKNAEEGAGVVVDVEEKEVADETPDQVLGGKASSSGSSFSTKAPDLETPWQQGPSNQGTASNTSKESSLPSNQVPWGQGPSQ